MGAGIGGAAHWLPEQIWPDGQAAVVAWQVPSAVQRLEVRLLPFAQFAAAHTVPTASRRQPPLPSQALLQASSRQVPLGSAPPAATLAQVPSWPGRAHDRQVPLQALAQHRPCVQNPLVQSPARVHTAPLGRLPQSPAVQTLPLAHWASPPQLIRQRLPLHP
jgi:hypothetical protein